MTTYEAIVVGGGVAGLKAAGALAKAGVSAALVDEGLMGGLVLNVGELKGAGDSQSGADFAAGLLDEALGGGVDYQIGRPVALERTGDLWSLPEMEIAAPRLVLATGAVLKTLGVPGEAALTGRGVSQCAYCDGGLYRDKPVAVVGGGDAAFQEAAHLAKLCSQVTILIRGAAPRARQNFQDAIAAAPTTAVRTGVIVEAIEGEAGVTGLTARDTATGAAETLEVDAVFPFIGLSPETSLAPAEAARDEDGALVVDAAMATSIPGVYAVGAARAGHGGGLADAIRDAETVAKTIGAAE